MTQAMAQPVGSMGQLGLLMTKEGLDALPRRRLCESPRGGSKKVVGGLPEASSRESERGWTRAHYHLLAALWLCYAVTMYGKGTLTLAIFGMGKDTKLGFDDADVSKLLAIGSGAYALGKLVGGPATDLLGGRGTLVGALAVMTLCLHRMGRCSSMFALSALWSAARFAAAVTWPGVMLAMRPWFLNNGQSSALSILTSSSRTGAFLGSYAGGELLAADAGWRGVATTTAVATLCVLALQLTLRGAPPPADDAAPASPAPPAAAVPRPLTRRDAAAVVAKSPKLFLVIFSTLFLMPTFDLTTLLPMYLDSLGMGADKIGRIGALYPLAAVPVILVTGALHQRLSPARRVFLYAPLLCVSAGGLVAFSFITENSPAIAYLLVLIMAGIAPALYCPNYDFILRFGGPYTGSITSLCDLFGNSFIALVVAAYPRMLAYGGWPFIFRFYAAQVLLAAVCILAFTVLEARNPLLTSPLENTHVHTPRRAVEV